MISKETLENINDSMMRRNKVSESMVGYNYSDRKGCELYRKGFTNEQAYNVTKRLARYATTQLEKHFNISKEELEKATSHYKDLYIKDNIYRGVQKPFVNIEVDLYDTLITFKYKKNYIELMKKKGAKWDVSRVAWVVPSTQAGGVLKELGKLGADVENAIERLDSIYDVLELI